MGVAASTRKKSKDAAPPQLQPVPRYWVDLAGICVLLAVLAAYSNHFQNGFHFDDSHAVETNPYIRSLANVPRFFTDARTFSSYPPDQNYRPGVAMVVMWLSEGPPHIAAWTNSNRSHKRQIGD